MNDYLEVRRRVELPDRFRIERCLRLPELGPRILFLSGGSALRKTARVLKGYTHNSTHVITSFDSGGSSAELRRVFRMPSIGDLRNRLLSLADESVQGNPEIYRLFSHRLPVDESSDFLEDRFRNLVSGRDPLVAALPSSMGSLVRTHLRAFHDHASGKGFDLRGASIGNLVLAAGYLENERHLDSVLFLFSKLVGALGQVVPVTEEYAHLAAHLSDGGRVLGQHRFRTAGAQIESIELVAGLEDPRPVSVSPNQKAIDAVGSADLLCLPMGSFYSSVVANLLPPGVTSAIAGCACPRVYVPNTGVDPEQGGRSAADCLEVLLSLLGHEGGAGRRRRSASSSAETASVRDDRDSGTAGSEGVPRDVPAGRPVRGVPVDFVLLDRSDAPYAVPPERERIRALGVDVIELDLVARARAAEAEELPAPSRERATRPGNGRAGSTSDPSARAAISPQRLVEALVSLA